GDGLVGNSGEDLLTEVEEVDIGQVPEIEELEVVLPVAVEQRDETVVVLHQLLRTVHRLTGDDVVERHRVRQRGEPELFHLVDRGADLDVPALEQAVPVLEVMTGATFEFR